MKNWIPAFTLMILSCNSSSHKQFQGASKDTAIQNKIDRNSVFVPFNNKKQLIGIWVSENKEPLTIDITEDSIFYTEHFESYKYEINVDSIYINYPDFIYSGKLYFYNDTLIMASMDGKSKFTKFK